MSSSIQYVPSHAQILELDDSMIFDAPPSTLYQNSSASFDLHQAKNNSRITPKRSYDKLSNPSKRTRI